MPQILITPAPHALIAPPFSLDSATRRVRMAEDAWNSRDPHRVAAANSEASVWRDRGDFIHGKDQIHAFLIGKWERELDFRLIMALWGFRDNRMAVRFQYEWRDAAGNWNRSYGNEVWEFDERGLMRHREASMNDVPITDSERTFLWDAPGPRPAEHAGLPELK